MISTSPLHTATIVLSFFSSSGIITQPEFDLSNVYILYFMMVTLLSEDKKNPEYKTQGDQIRSF